MLLQRSFQEDKSPSLRIYSVCLVDFLHQTIWLQRILKALSHNSGIDTQDREGPDSKRFVSVIFVYKVDYISISISIEIDIDIDKTNKTKQNTAKFFLKGSMLALMDRNRDSIRWKESFWPYRTPSLLKARSRLKGLFKCILKYFLWKMKDNSEGWTKSYEENLPESMTES